MNISTAVTQYLNDHRGRGSSKRTMHTVNWRLAKLLKFTQDKPVTAVTKAELTDYFDGLIDSGVSDGTLAGHKSTIRAFFNWLERIEAIEANPTRVLDGKRFSFKYDPVKSKPAPLDDFQVVVDALPRFAAFRGYSRRDVRDALIVSMAIDSGARRGEIASLRRADVIQALATQSQIYHVQSRGKTGAATVRFSEATASLARLWLEMQPPGATWLFCNLSTGERLEIGYMGKAFLRICEYAEVEPFRFQAVRKRNVVDMIRMTGDPQLAQKMAGHKDVRTTQRHYNVVEETAVNSAAAKLAQNRHHKPSELIDSFFQKL